MKMEKKKTTTSKNITLIWIVVRILGRLEAVFLHRVDVFLRWGPGVGPRGGRSVGFCGAVGRRLGRDRLVAHGARPLHVKPLAQAVGVEQVVARRDHGRRHLLLTRMHNITFINRQNFIYFFKWKGKKKEK